jgi:hypothetical protein
VYEVLGRGNEVLGWLNEVLVVWEEVLWMENEALVVSWSGVCWVFSWLDEAFGWGSWMGFLVSLVWGLGLDGMRQCIFSQWMWCLVES